MSLLDVQQPSSFELFAIRKTFSPISEITLALYAGASGDLNQVHINRAAAEAAGFDGLFAQGMLVMAYMGQALTDVISPLAIRSFTARFLAITQVGATLTCHGKPNAPFEEEGEMRVLIELKMVDQHSQVKLLGEAVVAL